MNTVLPTWLKTVPATLLHPRRPALRENSEYISFFRLIFICQRLLQLMLYGYAIRKPHGRTNYRHTLEKLMLGFVELCYILIACEFLIARPDENRFKLAQTLPKLLPGMSFWCIKWSHFSFLLLAALRYYTENKWPSKFFLSDKFYTFTYLNFSKFFFLAKVEISAM